LHPEVPTSIPSSFAIGTKHNRSTAKLIDVRKAVIDVGSNSVLLVVEERTADGWKQITEASSVTALGEGTKTTGLLGEPGMAATLKALKSMFDEAHACGVESIAAAATMAARIATNTPDFQARAAAQGTPVTVLSGEDEAQLGFQSVVSDPLFASQNRISIIDPGGQSTELVTAIRRDKGWDVCFRKSFPVGTLGLRSQMLGAESPDGLELLMASAAIDDTIGLCYLPNKVGQAVVLGATGTNLVSIREKLITWQPERVHGAYLEFEEVGKSVGWLSALSEAERRAVPGMEPGREKTIHIGSLILERFLSATGAPGCAVSVRGWRHALLEQE